MTEVNPNAQSLPANRSMPASTVIPELAYGDVAEAVEWLCGAFGFEERLRIGNHRAQLTFGQGSVIVTQLSPTQETLSSGTPSPGSQGGNALTHSVMVRVEEIDRHYERAAQHGARIIHPPAITRTARGSIPRRISEATSGLSRRPLRKLILPAGAAACPACLDPEWSISIE